MNVKLKEIPFINGNINSITLSPNEDGTVLIIVKIIDETGKSYVEYFSASAKTAVAVREKWSKKDIKMIIGKKGIETFLFR